MTKRDPYVVLGVEPGSSATQIKAAWRRLARAHHPDLTGDDPEASRIATRQMAEINDAYAALVRNPAAGRPGHRPSGAEGRAGGPSFDAGEPRPRRGGPPRPKPTRPVTGRLDTSGTVPPRNQATSPRRRAHPLAGQPPLRLATERREPPRASDPTGPLRRGRIRNFRRPPAPALADAEALEIDFGKFRGHTLGQVAAFEPSYVDWLARTITRDPELVAATRVIKADLDERGVVRREHPTAPPAPRPAGRSA